MLMLCMVCRTKFRWSAWCSLRGLRKLVTLVFTVLVSFSNHDKLNRLTDGKTLSPDGYYTMFKILSRVKRLGTGFEVVTGFIGILQVATTVNYSAIANSHTLILLNLLFLHRLSPGNGSQSRRIFTFHVPGIRSSLAGAFLTTNSSRPQPLAIDS
jgi:hypothetical protein